jgi:nitrate reductase beta subunit
MMDMYQNVSDQMDPLTKLISQVPGFNGYVKRENRRAADKLIRNAVADRFEELWKRVSTLQADLVTAGKIEYVDDMEKASIQIRTFVDKIRTAARGYAGMFDAVKINEKELEQIYKYDLAFFDQATEIGRGIDNVEASTGDDTALPAAIRNITSLARQAVETLNRRSETITGIGK